MLWGKQNADATSVGILSNQICAIGGISSIQESRFMPFKPGNKNKTQVPVAIQKKIPGERTSRSDFCLGLWPSVGGVDCIAAESSYTKGKKKGEVD
jgi:hypothetical protein